MITTSKINMDLNRHCTTPVIQVMQDDRYSRNLEFALFQNGSPWTIPEDVSVVIRYGKADGLGGVYDTLPDGSRAWSAAENRLTVALAPQVLTVPGAVTVTVSLIQQHLQISLFSAIFNVNPLAHAQISESEPYFHVVDFVPAPYTGQPGQYLRIASTNDMGHVTAVDAVDLEIDAMIQNDLQLHNMSDDSHPDIRQKLAQKLGTDSTALTDAQQTQIRENIGLEVLMEKNTEIVTGINLNDGIYEYGRFTVAGDEYDAEGNLGIRNVNFLPVEGGRAVVAYYDPAAWNNNTTYYSIQIVQYDSHFVKIGNRNSISNYGKDPSSYLMLDSRTAYIRIDYNGNGIVNILDLAAPKIGLYYQENAVSGFVEYETKTTTTLMVRKEKIAGLEPLAGKKIVYDGDSICSACADNAGGGYAKIIADLTGGTYTNHAQGGARLCANVSGHHCIADNLMNLPDDGDLYCFQGGINDYWGNAALGTYTPENYTDAVDATTVCGALETIFRYALNHFPEKPVCFIITHKIQNAAYQTNGAGNTFQDYRDAMAGICRKYSIPFYDAFSESGLNGWNTAQSDLYLTGNENGSADGCHPNQAGYERFYVPQLLDLFRKILPAV